MARLDRQNALAAALRRLGVEPGGNPQVPRLPGLTGPAAEWGMATYRHLGGTLTTPTLRPLGWDIPTTSGLIVELDEEQHFNRYRAATLEMSWAADLPWREDYIEYCAQFESIALKTHSGGGFWTSTGSVAQFGPAGTRGRLDQGGSPRWKQRAVYDALRDAVAAAGSVALARLSVHDRVGVLRLGDALRGDASLDLHELRELINKRTMGGNREVDTQDLKGFVARPSSSAPTGRVSSSMTFVPAELARKLGYHEESRPGLVVRSYLRKRYPGHPKNAPWVLDEEQANDVLANVPRNG